MQTQDVNEQRFSEKETHPWNQYFVERQAWSSVKPGFSERDLRKKKEKKRRMKTRRGKKRKKKEENVR